MFSIHVSAGFWGLISHLDQVTLYLYQDSNEKTIPLNIIVSASKFSKLKRGSGICNCFGNFTIREKNPLLLRHHDVINFGSCYLKTFRVQGQGVSTCQSEEESQVLLQCRDFRIINLRVVVEFGPWDSEHPLVKTRGGKRRFAVFLTQFSNWKHSE